MLPPWPTRGHLLGACAVSTQCQCQPESTSINFISTRIKLADSLKWQKSPFQLEVTLREKWPLAVSGSDLGLELVTSCSLRQNSSWTCVSTSFSLACIDSQALICTMSCFAKIHRISFFPQGCNFFFFSSQGWDLQTWYLICYTFSILFLCSLGKRPPANISLFFKFSYIKICQWIYQRTGT